MAKKLTDVFDDEILESKKPAGCVGGIFQLFDCQQLLGGKQLSEQGNRRVPSGTTSKLSSIFWIFFITATLNQLQDLESNEKNSNIVAKLMGLEPLNSATQNSIRCNDFFSEQKKNQMLDHERKHEKPLQSPRNIARSPRRNNPHLDFASKFPIEETPRMAQGYVEENMNRKIQSVLNTAEKRPQKLRCHHSNMELRYLKRVLLETKENGNRKLSSVNSLRTKLTPPSKKSIPERAFKSPIVILEPARKLDVSYSKVTKLEDLPGLGEIRTSDSRSNRKKDLFNTQTNADQSFVDKKAKCRGPHPSSKEQNERAVNDAVSPRLQHMKPDLKMKAFAAIPSYYDSNKSPRRPVKSQLLDSVSPRCKFKNKSNKIQDIELQNSGEQVNVEAIRANNSIEVKSLLLQQSIQSSSVKVGNGGALVSEAKKHAVQLKDLSAKEHSLISPRCSCPNSAPNALLNQDGLLHSPVSVSKVFKEYQNLPSDCNFTKECPPLTIRTTVSPRTDSEIPESKNTIIQGSRDLRTTVNEARVTNAALEIQDQDSTIVAEIFLVCGLLQKESDLLSMLEQITSDKPYEFVQKSNPEKLHQKLILDVVNEILAQKLDVSCSSNWFNHMLRSRSFSIKHLYKELCSEIKCLQSCNEGNWDDNSMIHKDVLRHPQAWDSFEREIPALVLEIERLIFKDLINDVVNGVTADALYAKQRRQRQMLAKDGI